MNAAWGWRRHILKMALDQIGFICQWSCVHSQQDWIYYSALSFHCHSLRYLVSYLPPEEELYEYTLCFHLFFICHGNTNVAFCILVVSIHQKNPVHCYVENIKLLMEAMSQDKFYVWRCWKILKNFNAYFHSLYAHFVTLAPLLTFDILWSSIHLGNFLSSYHYILI